MVLLVGAKGVGVSIGEERDHRREGVGPHARTIGPPLLSDLSVQQSIGRYSGIHRYQGMVTLVEMRHTHSLHAVIHLKRQFVELLLGDECLWFVYVLE